MNEPLSDELLSAYLDGELPREDRARVEDWLTASAEHRRLLEDLKAIRRELQALPKQSLDAGFSDRVLAAIRQRSGESSNSPTAVSGSSPASDASETIPIKPVNLPNKHLGMPAWRWFAAGVAATLLAVIVGMNAAPEAMAQLGQLAQVVQPPARELAHKKAEPLKEGNVATATPSAGAPVNVEATPSAGSGAGVRQRHSGAIADQANKDMRESFVEGAGQRKVAPSEQSVAPQVESPVPSTPNLVTNAATAPGAVPAPVDMSKDGRESPSGEAKKETAAEFANGQATIAYDNVVELPVTGEQADRALALYASKTGRQAARRYTTTTTLAVNANEETADRFAADEERETFFQRSASGKSLMKLMEAAQGVEVAALEVTGPEAEVQALLDSLGVAEARDLRPSREMFGGGAGGVALRSNREGEEIAAEADAKPAAAKAKADSAIEAEESKGGSPASKSVSRGGGSGSFPSVQMRSVYNKNEPARDQAKQARGSQQEGGDAAQPLLRVRLVFVPAQADPIGPTIEVKPE